MVVNRMCVFFRLAAVVAVSAAVVSAAVAQSANPSSATNAFYGSVLSHPATDELLRLSLDQAVRMGLDNNLGLKQAENDEKSLNGQKNVALQNFLPTISVAADLGVHQQNLAAMGFGPGTMRKFASLLGFSTTGSINTITRDDLAEGKIQYQQMLFSGPVISGWQAARAALNAAHFERTAARGEVVQQVATAYLHAIAAASEVDNARALEAADKVLYEQAHAAHEAGTASNLDELRARVQLQAEQQQVIAAENSFEKALILLKREIGVAPGQKLQLSDPAPYSELALRTPEELRAVAYQNRQDYQRLQNELAEMKAVHNAYRAQRLPSLSFGGQYAVSHVNDAGTHGNFVAQANLSFPLFREAKLRGDADAAQAQTDAVRAQLSDLRNQIDLQVRSALLDVAASQQLVASARSNVELATRALADETDRVAAGVDDNLPLVQAQATLASAETNLVESVYQYNVNKLVLARSTGMLEQQYRDYLGK